VADVAVRGAELFSVKLPKASQHNFILSEERFDLSRPCDQILEFASAAMCVSNEDGSASRIKRCNTAPSATRFAEMVRAFNRVL
jgi:hypothetical protein